MGGGREGKQLGVVDHDGAASVYWDLYGGVGGPGVHLPEVMRLPREHAVSQHPR